ncbi:NAD(P)-dependent alcohol dehydrogenase [Embleya scabrispora]|uniref:NAD(P)-dependent alcohol dehydrogenase n=1 Tax=Embleya scabrispora TaxID=159449 RepID=A0A1T3NPQ7_9ACTN|nr:NAD(P)-dependent alcohol dehydrogenase [Embleya scabrispora]OPC78754.1 NAD(P)-dependent alcohol dehydrogenase [Embleya scabrispora]
MRAFVQDEYGPPDVLRCADVERPVVGDADVLVRVRAAGVDPGVWHLITGRPYLLRLTGFGLRAPKVKVRGVDVAGVVEAVGPKVTRFRPGDAVFGTCRGAFAEYACAEEDRLAPKPAILDFEQAAAVAVSGYAALQALRDAGRVRSGQSVLIVGAAGGIGTYAVGLAKVFGARVTGVCGAGKADLVRSLGADEVIDYTREDFTDGARHWDLIVDTAGHRRLADLRRALTPRGTLVLVGSETGGRWLGGTDRTLRAVLLSPFVRHRLRGLVSTERPDDLRFLRETIESGRLTPVLDRTFPFTETPEAVRYIHAGHARGKVVVKIP